MELYEVSIIMPAYNAEKYIEKTIKSVLAQTFKSWELIIIDDCSEDSTLAIVEEFAKNYSNIKILKNERNSGTAVTRNNGIDVATGKYIAFLDSDDLWSEDKLEKQMELALKHENEVLIYSSYGFIDENDRRILKDYIVPEETDYKAMLKENVIGCSTVLMSRTLLDRFRFLADIYNEDYALWMQILKYNKDSDVRVSCIGQRDVLMFHRQLDTAKSINKKKAAKERWKIYRRVLNINPVSSLYYFAAYTINGIKKYRRD